MSQSTLFVLLLVTALLVINGVRELSRGNYGMGALLFSIPAAGWLSIVFGATQ